MSKREIKGKVYKALKTGPKGLDELQASIGTYTSKKDIADKLGVNQSTISNILNGDLFFLPSQFSAGREEPWRVA